MVQPQIYPPYVQDLLSPNFFYQVYLNNEEDEVSIIDLSMDGKNIERHALTNNIVDVQRPVGTLLPLRGNPAMSRSSIRPTSIYSGL